MIKRLLALTVALVVGVGLFAGCDDTPEAERSVVFVANVNEGAPVIADVLEQGEDLALLSDDFIAPDWILFQFGNRPYNDVIFTAPGFPHGDFIITRYDITWTRVDGGSPALPPYSGNTNIRVGSGELVEAAILLVNFNNKLEPMMTALQYGAATPVEILMRADIVFTGHEAGTDRETQIQSSLSVSFADLVIETDKKEK